MKGLHIKLLLKFALLLFWFSSGSLSAESGLCTMKSIELSPKRLISAEDKWAYLDQDDKIHAFEGNPGDLGRPMNISQPNIENVQHNEIIDFWWYKGQLYALGEARQSAQPSRWLLTYKDGKWIRPSGFTESKEDLIEDAKEPFLHNMVRVPNPTFEDHIALIIFRKNIDVMISYSKAANETLRFHKLSDEFKAEEMFQFKDLRKQSSACQEKVRYTALGASKTLVAIRKDFDSSIDSGCPGPVVFVFSKVNGNWQKEPRIIEAKRSYSDALFSDSALMLYDRHTPSDKNPVEIHWIAADHYESFSSQLGLVTIAGNSATLSLVERAAPNKMQVFSCPPISEKTPRSLATQALGLTFVDQGKRRKLLDPYVMSKYPYIFKTLDSLPSETFPSKGPYLHRFVYRYCYDGVSVACDLTSQERLGSSIETMKKEWELRCKKNKELDACFAASAVEFKKVSQRPQCKTDDKSLQCKQSKKLDKSSFDYLKQMIRDACKNDTYSCLAMASYFQFGNSSEAKFQLNSMCKQNIQDACVASIALKLNRDPANAIEDFYK